MRVCSYPLCKHEGGGGGGTAGCKMHKLPSDLEKCRSWMRNCRLAGTPRKLPGAIHICSCHFEGMRGPTLENPTPAVFHSPAHLGRPFPLKVFRPHTTKYAANQNVKSLVESAFVNSGRLLGNEDAGHIFAEVLKDASIVPTLSDASTTDITHDSECGVQCLLSESDAIPQPDCEVTFPLQSFGSFEVEVDGVNYDEEKGDGCAMRLMKVSTPEPASASPRMEVAGASASMSSSYSARGDSDIGLLHSSFDNDGINRQESDLAQPLLSFESADFEDDDFQVDKDHAHGSDFKLKRVWGTEKASISTKKYANSPERTRDFAAQCAFSLLSYDRSLCWSNEDFTYFTGVSKESFDVLYEFLGGDKLCCKLKYKINANTPAREIYSSHSPRGKLFMTLMRLRRGYPLKDMSLFFNMSEAAISCIFLDWVKLMSIKFESLEDALFVSVAVQSVNQPDCYKPFPNLCIVDSTEIKIQKPSNMQQQSHTYSTYKSCNTAKFLVASSVYGGLSFVSNGVEGSMSDRKLFLKSGILDHLNPGEAVMADRGFDIEADLNKHDIDLIIPPFLGTREAFTERENYEQKGVSTTRIHVETVIGRIKQWRFLRYIVPNTMLDILTDIFRVCAILTNFRDPFIKWHDNDTGKEGYNFVID